MGLEAGGGGRGAEEEMEKEKEKKIPHMCESIGHQPLRAAALLPLNFNHNLLRQGTSTADHLTLLQTI